MKPLIFPRPFLLLLLDPGSGMEKIWIRNTHVGPMVPVAEAGVPEERQVDALELGVAEVLSPPALDVLDPVDDDGPPQDVGQAQDVRLLQRRPGLARQAAHQQTTFPSRFILKGLCHEMNDFLKVLKVKSVLYVYEPMV